MTPQPGRGAPPPSGRAVRPLVRVGHLLVRATAVVAAVAVLAFGVVVGTDVDRWRGVLPNLDGITEQDRQRERVDRLFAGADAAPGVRATGRGRPFRFMADPPAAAGAVGPGHWCSRDVIGYRMDVAAVKAAGLDPDLEERRWANAFDAWGRASRRYTFEYRGRSQYPLILAGDERGMKINEASIPDGEIAITYALADAGATGARSGYIHHGLAGALGIAGISRISWAPGSPSRGLIRHGTIVMAAADRDPGNERPTAYVHEAGHALGLAHVDDDTVIMNAQAADGAGIGRGDVRGIRHLARQGCPRSAA